MRVHKISSGAWLRYHGDVQHDEGRPSGYSLLGRASHTHGHESETVGPRPWAIQCVRNVVAGSKSMYEAVDFVQLYAVSPMA